MGGRGTRPVARADITGAGGPMPAAPPTQRPAFAPTRRSDSPSLSPAQGSGQHRRRWRADPVQDPAPARSDAAAGSPTC